MRRYMKFRKVVNNKIPLIDLISFKESEKLDEIMLDTDISYEEYNDDIIINGKNDYLDDIYLDDMINYYD